MKRKLSVTNLSLENNLPMLVKEALHIQLSPLQECFNRDGGLEVPGCWTTVMRRRRGRSNAHWPWSPTGADPGGAWEAHAPPPFGTEQAQNTEVYRVLRARSYSNAVHISLSITASCPANIKHSNLQLPRDSSVAVPRIQGWFRKEGAPRNDHTMSYCPAAITFSDGLRSTLIWSKFQNFPEGACPRPPQNTMHYTHTETACAAWLHQKKKHCIPPLLKTLDLPLSNGVYPQ